MYAFVNCLKAYMLIKIHLPFSQRNSECLQYHSSLPLDCSREVGLHITCPEDVRVIDATGRYVIPGGVDPHTHFRMPFSHGTAVDDFFTGTRAALAGGTTCISE